VHVVKQDIFAHILAVQSKDRAPDAFPVAKIDIWPSASKSQEFLEGFKVCHLRCEVFFAGALFLCESLLICVQFFDFPKTLQVDREYFPPCT